MSKMFEENKLRVSLIIILFLFISFIIGIPKISAPPPPSLPDQVIGEILPNKTLSLNLLKSNVLITINSSSYPNIIGFEFNANYTIFNPGIDTNLKLALPFSLGIEVDESNFEVKVNETKIEFDLSNFTGSSMNDTEIDLDFFPIYNPIKLIQCNISTLENTSYIIGYKFHGLIINPLIDQDVLFLTYYLNSSKTWKGNTTGKAEFRVYGKIPVFSTMGYSSGDTHPQIFDIIGGKSCIWEWTNIKMNMLAIGICYDERYYPYPILGSWDIVISIMIIIIVVAIILSLWKKSHDTYYS
jgi:hypothetical protein